MKSGWPGVSIRLTVASPISNETTAALIVMPRCRSSAADLVDDSGRVEQPLGESGLTGVYMRQDSQVECRSLQGSSPSKS
jgi:hypothetical protein